MNRFEKEELKSMSLGDHLEELRARLILIILGVFAGLIACMFFGNSLIAIMSKPFNRVVEELEKKRLLEIQDQKDLETAGQQPQAVIVTHDPINGYNVYTSQETISNVLKVLEQGQEKSDSSSIENSAKADSSKKGQTVIIGRHPTEGFVVYATEDDVDKVLNLLAESEIIPGDHGLRTKAARKPRAVIVTQGPVEGFMVYITTCMLFGLLFTSPWVIWQIWAFVAAGLYAKERRYVHIVAPISATLFVIGTLFFILGVAPQMMGFLIRFDAAMGVQSLWSLKKYINMVFSLTLVFGAAFQMPIVIVFAERLGLVTVEALARNRKFVAMGLVIIAAIATPPDVISQISLAIPLYGLYEASIIFCRFMGKRKSQQI